MLSIPEVALQIVDKALSERIECSARTIFVVGSKSVGKSTLVHTFLEKNENARETLVLEYSFGRKSVNKQSIEKSICHIWEYGGKLNLLNNVLSSVPVNGKYYYVILVDLSRLKHMWNTLETCINAISDANYDDKNSPELIIMGGKYDIFKNYDTEIKKCVCTTIRSVALINNAHLVFYSMKEPQLVKRAKELLYGIGFVNGFVAKEKQSNISKPLFLPKGSDTWESIGVAPSSMEVIKSRHISKVGTEVEAISSDEVTMKPQQTHPEPILDSMATAKYEELRNMESFDMSVNDYLGGLHK